MKREIHELKMITQNVKEELKKIWKTSEKRFKQKSWKYNVLLAKQKTWRKATPAD
jgi:hypothetical protein